MSLLRNFLRGLACAAGIHSPLKGVQPRWSIYWACRHCGEVRPGEILSK